MPAPLLARQGHPFCWLVFAVACASHISPNHDLECGVDDVIRRALNEGRVLLNCNCDWALNGY
jgi:hypothetical protein